MSVVGRTILVTGASAGLGEAIVHALAEAGARVVAVARRIDRLEKLESRWPAQIYAAAADVRDYASIRSAAEQGAARFGGIDGVIANAAVTTATDVATGDPVLWEDVLRTNLLGSLHTVRASLPHFPATGPRDVVLVGSTVTRTAIADLTVYSASKGGLDSAFSSMRLSLTPRGIRCCLLLPGRMESELVDHIRSDARIDVGNADRTAHYGTFTPMDPAAAAAATVHVLAQPENVTIEELVIRPFGQLAP
ncbi:SDR family oxidoreductase [Nocardia alni]|uniref:SDR family oxidoreductase n=1 Tax=Nocardia alni TaxID=2815723 RepID=UPI001C21C359|nr:SDR family oxidoreductase [Nocardia alni]